MFGWQAVSRLLVDSFLPPGARISSGPNARVNLMVLPGVLLELADNWEKRNSRLQLEYSAGVGFRHREPGTTR